MGASNKLGTVITIQGSRDQDDSPKQAQTDRIRSDLPRERREAAEMECGGDVGWRIGRIRQAAAVVRRAEHA